MQKYIIGIDLGGTKISGAISNEYGKILHEITVQTLAKEGADAVVGRIKGVIRELMDHQRAVSEEIIGVGIGSPGPLDAKKGIIVNAANLPGFVNLPLVDLIEKEFKVKAYIENDANAAALGELWFGAGRGCKNFVFITVSTGVGSGIIINGDIYQGNTSNAGEVGHMTLEPEGPRCNCGNYGCLEALASGPAIERIANERLAKCGDSMLNNYKKVTSKEVFEAAAKGDKLANEVVSYCMNYLGIGMANVVSLLDPEKIIIGGGVSKAGAVVFDTIRNVIDKRCFKIMAQGVKVVPAELGTDAGVVGAIGIVLSKMKKLD
jgi:ROK family protein (putative glucokinase)